MPSNHLKSGCRACGVNLLKNSKSVFINKAVLIHKNKYNYSKVNYVNSKEKVIIICPEHGEFLQRPNDHLTNHGCSKCGGLILSDFFSMGLETFIYKANIKHNFLYLYENNTEYKNNKYKINIQCKIHGNFKQEINAHLQGAGCSECNRSSSTFHKTAWIKRAKDRKGTFYIIKCWNDCEEFYKLGITYRSIIKRYRKKDKKCMPYNYEIVKTVESTDLGYIWDLEKRFKRFKKKQHYTPLIHFHGCITECFK